MRLTRRQLNKLILEELSLIREEKSRNRYSMKSFLFEQEETDMTPFTLVALYGPPAAGKGAAKKFVKSQYGGAEQEETIQGYLSGIEDPEAREEAKNDIDEVIALEEDKWMTSITTGEFPKAVFMDVYNESGGDPAKWDQAAAKFFHVNESDRKFLMRDLISANTFADLMARAENDPERAAQMFADFPETKSWFAQARGFSTAPEGMEQYAEYMGPQGGPEGSEQTLGIRAKAATKYINDVEGAIERMMANAEQFGHLFLADQAGESTTNVERIKALGALKNKGVKVIGVYIHQPLERTTVANLHRASMDQGGRRVSQEEVDAIAGAGPTFDAEGNITEKGQAIEAMEQADFDAIYVYHPKSDFSYETEVPGVGGNHPIASTICEPFGDGTGMLDIEGCDDPEIHPGDQGPTVDADTLTGMEAKAARVAKVGDSKGYLPSMEDMTDEQEDRVVQALTKLGFTVNKDSLADYLRIYRPSKADRDAPEAGKKDFGSNPYGAELFGKMNPKHKVTVKESYERQNQEDAALARWQRLAGIK